MKVFPLVQNFLEDTDKSTHAHTYGHDNVYFLM